MGLIKCKACGAEISKKAKKCPQCGDPQSQPSFVLRFFLFIIIIGFLSAVINDDSVDVDKHKPANKSASIKQNDLESTGRK